MGTGDQNQPPAQEIGGSEGATRGKDNPKIEPVAPTWVYVIAWFAAMFFGGVLSTLAVEGLAAAMVETYDDLDLYLVVGSIVTWGVMLVTWIGVYSFLYKSLNMGKVMPWLWGLGALGVVVTLIAEIGESQEYGADDTLSVIYAVMTISCYVATMLLFRAYFRRRGRL